MSTPAVSRAVMRQELQLFYPEPSDALLNQLGRYLALLLKWNERTNLTAIHQPIDIVRKHFGESLFASLHVPEGTKTLLDLGSGAGFPGLPIQLARLEMQVTLAESQNKKAAFLREVVRVLGLPTEVWGQRAESMPYARRFNAVTLRAVDRPLDALEEAQRRLAEGGRILQLTSKVSEGGAGIPIPATNGSVLLITKA